MIYSDRLSEVMNRYSEIKEESLQGRYIHLEHINPLLKRHASNFKIRELGKSVLGKSIHSIEVGTGKIKILAWSQMHGNESTTTKTIFDLLNAFIILKDVREIQSLLSNCSILIIPMLNPDGAEAYTRVNANQVDLNRDAQDLKEPESRILRDTFDKFQPDFCLNLHGQRTIFSAGKVKEPATLSFLTPAMDPERKIYKEREMSMQVIAEIVSDLSQVLPERIGRYDDGYNINCTGDSFQTEEVPTVLFEAGHFPGDYQREKVREFVFAALLSSLYSISNRSYLQKDHLEYFKIPQNEKLFNDIIIRNVLINNQQFDVAIQYSEELNDNKVIFVPIIEKITPKITNYGHREIDAKGEGIQIFGGKELIENVIVEKIVLNAEILSFKCG